MPRHPDKPVSNRSAGERIRCGVVGVGKMGGYHAAKYAKLKGVEFVGVVDSNPQRAEAVAESWSCRPFTSERELLDAGVDAVSIAVPTSAHMKSARPFLEAGVACLVEKPLAPDGETAWALKELAEQNGVCLMVGHIERFNPVVQAMEKLRGEGHEVTPRFIEVHRVSPMTFRSVDVGVVMDMMIHDIDVVLNLMGGAEPVEVQASGVAVVTEHEDICNARLRFETEAGPCVANISASRLAFKTERLTRITGEGGYIKIDYAAKKGTVIRRTANELQRQEVIEQLRAGADLSDLDWSELVNIEPLEIEEIDQLEMEICAFLDAVRTGRRPPIDAEAGFVNVRTAERIVGATKEFIASLEPFTTA
ncbi:MAG: Gfo/Idh/MocA family oxidoreductase [Phycisphaeraceae bacterium]|nr:MAG: Gfo/Idh/MocA family oxidoreductase [Phycisphaeraceae bacterium]